LGLSINKYHLANKFLEESNSLKRLAQKLSNSMSTNENFVVPNLSNRTTDTLIIEKILAGNTSISQYDFSINRKYKLKLFLYFIYSLILLILDDFEKITCFDNCSKQNNSIECTKNIAKYLGKYNRYGSAYSIGKNGDILMRYRLYHVSHSSYITLTFEFKRNSCNISH